MRDAKKVVYQKDECVQWASEMRAPRIVSVIGADCLCMPFPVIDGELELGLNCDSTLQVGVAFAACQVSCVSVCVCVCVCV